ncbi:MAG: hypothetical protein R2860_08830 [Desulfobacterales bacterium]
MIAVIIGVWTMVALTSLMRGMITDMVENGIATLTGDMKIYPAKYHEDPSVAYQINDPAAVLSKIAGGLLQNANLPPGCGLMRWPPMPGIPLALFWWALIRRRKMGCRLSVTV